MLSAFESGNNDCEKLTMKKAKLAALVTHICFIAINILITKIKFNLK